MPLENAEPKKDADLATVLVIDDELGPRESLRILLKGQYNIICSESVDKGLRILAEERPDLIILDIRMPEKSGIDGLREIREIDPDVSVIMLTGFGALETAQEALRLGANDYLKKPFDTKEMQEVIRRNVQRTKLERRRGRAALELRELNNRLVNELSEKEEMASVGQASAEFVHDLRNPLSIVIGYVELLSEQLDECRDNLGGRFQETLEYVDVIEKNVQRCHEMAHMWQKLAKGESGRQALFSITRLVKDVVVGVEPLAAASRCLLTYEEGARDFQVLGSSAQLLRAIHNVVANALHAVAEKNGSIRVTAREDAGFVEINVTDDGCGMTEEEVSRACEAYYTSKEGNKGTGLGLFITKKILEDHHGTIAIQSRPQQGTTVVMRLPLATEDMAKIVSG